MDTAQQAQQAFYGAFMRCSLSAMAAIWAEGDVICVHPGSDVLQGKKVVMASWERILSPGHEPNIDIEIISAVVSDDVAVFVVYEHIQPDPSQPLVTVIATNVYRRISGIWQIVEHHGSQPIRRPHAVNFNLPPDTVLQ